MCCKRDAFPVKDPQGSGTRVCAAAVAYRNPAELRTLLASLVAQTRRPDALFLVDNSVESAAVMANRSVFDELSDAFYSSSFYALPANVGSAGGFKFCMQQAYAEGFDWVWLLDQDGAADPLCLERLLEARDGTCAVLCPVVRSIADRATELAFRANISFWGNFSPVYVASGKEARQITGFATHGVLIGRLAVDEAGYYDDRNFFCGWEDYDYAFRILRCRLPVKLVSIAVVYHPDLGVKYNEARRGELSPLSRLYVRLNAFLPMPVFLGVAGRGKGELGELRNTARLRMYRKNLGRFRYVADFLFSSFVLCLLRLVGKRIPLAESLRMYLKTFGEGFVE